MKKLLVVFAFALLPICQTFAQPVTLPHLSKEGKEFKVAIDHFKHQVEKYIKEAETNPSSGPAICQIVQELADYSYLSQAYNKYTDAHNSHLEKLQAIQAREMKPVRPAHWLIFLGTKLSYKMQVGVATRTIESLTEERTALLKYLNRPTELGWFLSLYIVEHRRECPDLSEEFMTDAKKWVKRLEKVEFVKYY